MLHFPASLREVMQSSDGRDVLDTIESVVQTHVDHLCDTARKGSLDMMRYRVGYIDGMIAVIGMLATLRGER